MPAQSLQGDAETEQRLCVFFVLREGLLEKLDRPLVLAGAQAFEPLFGEAAGRWRSNNLVAQDFPFGQSLSINQKHVICPAQ